ncbi:MAG: hypothetical protein ACERKD_09430 [Prolixibacteraceae bacterium]
MNWIVAKEKLSDQTIRLEIRSSDIALKFNPGHHVIIQLTKDGDRIPLVISDVNLVNESFSVFIPKKEVIHYRFGGLNVGDVIHSLEGPLGEPIAIEQGQTIICAAGGIGILPLLPIVKALKKAGNTVYTVLGARSKEFIILENEFRKISDELHLYTDDGSVGGEGFVTEGILDLLQRKKVSKVITFGPSRMIKYSFLLTRRYDVPLTATLYAMRLVGNAIGGIYSVAACDRSKYICVDGNDYNAFYPDFDAMIKGMEGFLKEDDAGNQNYQQEMSLFAPLSK